jgi:hypothetical protein
LPNDAWFAATIASNRESTGFFYQIVPLNGKQNSERSPFAVHRSPGVGAVRTSVTLLVQQLLPSDN